MKHPALSLQAEVYSKLIQHQPLISLLGGEFIYDDVPPKQELPYIVFAESAHNDWSTGTEEGMEHFISLNTWSLQNGRKQALQISHEITNSLKAVSTQIDGHLLVNFAHELTEVNRDEDTGFFVAKVTFRAVTEPST